VYSVPHGNVCSPSSEQKESIHENQEPGQGTEITTSPPFMGKLLDVFVTGKRRIMASVYK